MPGFALQGRCPRLPARGTTAATALPSYPHGTAAKSLFCGDARWKGFTGSFGCTADGEKTLAYFEKKAALGQMKQHGITKSVQELRLQAMDPCSDWNLGRRKPILGPDCKTVAVDTAVEFPSECEK
jgi:hypothetical protein